MLGCGSSTPSGGTGGTGGGGASGTSVIEATIPKDDANGTGWKVDQTSSNVAAGKVAGIATSLDQASNSTPGSLALDGSADPFYANSTPTYLALQNYVNTKLNLAGDPPGYSLKLLVLQMAGASEATALYASLVDGTHSLYTSNTWTDPSPAIGDASRITNSGTDWWVNFRKGVFYVEVRLTYAESTDVAGKTAAVAFAKSVADKM
jgi:hypothetical protein